MRTILLFLVCLACLPCEGRIQSVLLHKSIFNTEITELPETTETSLNQKLTLCGLGELGDLGVELTHATTPIQTVIFDFGKVIATIDSELLIDFLSTSCKISKEQATEAIHKFGAHQLQGGEEKAFWEQYQKQYHVPYSNGMWRRQWNRAKILAMKEIPGMLNLVEALQKKGFQTALFSNVTSECAEIVTKAGFYDYFDPVFLSYQMKMEKPHPVAYEKVLKKLALPAEACLFIDDRAENIETAQKIGFDTILFENPAQLVEELNKRGIVVQLKEAAHAA